VDQKAGVGSCRSGPESWGEGSCRSEPERRGQTSNTHKHKRSFFAIMVKISPFFYFSPKRSTYSTNIHTPAPTPLTFIFFSELTHAYIIHVIELLCYNWRFANFWLEILTHNWRFFIDVFDACFYCLLMFSFCLFCIEPTASHFNIYCLHFCLISSVSYDE
jgi:hypothetical protein